MGAIPGTPVQAWGGARKYGSGHQIVDWNGAPAYRILVDAQHNLDGCGALGRSIHLVLTWQARVITPWANTSATYLPIDAAKVVYPFQLFFPAARR